MDPADEWGRDPNVRSMRRIFSRLEAAQEALFLNLRIPRFDPRLRRWREQARIAFDRSCAKAASLRIQMNEDLAGVVYIHGLAGIMATEGVEVPVEILPGIDRFKDAVKEILP